MAVRNCPAAVGDTRAAVDDLCALREPVTVDEYPVQAVKADGWGTTRRGNCNSRVDIIPSKRLRRIDAVGNYIAVLKTMIIESNCVAATADRSARDRARDEVLAEALQLDRVLVDNINAVARPIREPVDHVARTGLVDHHIGVIITEVVVLNSNRVEGCVD